MADLQKTIKGLRCHSEPKFGPDEYFCETCPYDEATCGLDVPNDALSLLKAQEPRVMTPIDFDDNPMVDENGKLPAWVEYKRYNGVLRPADGWGTINRNWVDGYRDRRFWTSQPSAEQMEATPWKN